ncbi:MAG TPA: CARDB domain-containing protein, partial [Acidobacteriota bacterium]|nr:CARDB domain-containing protein [Acidobacteriota bacterium]
HALIAMAPLLDIYSIATQFADSAVVWLKTQPHGDGGFGTGDLSNPYETGLALAAISLIDPASPAAANARSYLETTQLPNGSWNDDAYSTALALYGLIHESNLFSRSVTLAPGMNLLGLPVAPVAPMTSADLCSLVTGCEGITGWDRVGQDWLTVPFDVAVQDACFVQTSACGSAPLVGTLLGENQCDMLEEGLNAISVPNENACYTAMTLMDDIGSCTEIHEWDQEAQKWASLIEPPGDTLRYGTDFEINSGRGYFVRRPVGAGASEWCTRACDTITPPETLPDLLITSYDIIIDPNPVMQNEQVGILGLVHNIGTDTAFGPALDFYLGDPDAGGGYMATYNIPENIPPGASASQYYGYGFTFTGCGTGEIYLVVDPSNSIAELSEDNNKAHETLVILCAKSAADSSLISAPEIQGPALSFAIPSAADRDETDLLTAVAPAISNVTVGSVTSSSATISWVTDSLSFGGVNYGTASVGEYTLCEWNWWGGWLHLVELDGLEPETSYLFEVESGETVDDNDGAYYSFTTTSVGAGKPGTVYGKVLLEDSTPAPMAIVSATLADAGGAESSQLSVMAGWDGSWVFNLGNLKDPVGNGVMEYASGDTVHLSAQGGADGTGGITIVLSGTFPEDAGAIVLSPCACDCHADPECDGVTSILDVVLAVNVAFRGGDPIPDPNPACPFETTDVNCDNVTNILDVILLVDVAFRGGDPAEQFCDPCL